jgi:hypothetical protein
MTTLSTPRSMPFPAHWSVRQARDAYLAENGFTVEAYDDRWTQGSFFGVRLALLNTRRHRWAIMLHDLHHVVTGYGTNLVGEGEISAWELRHGWRSLGLYVGSIVLFGAVMGVALSPRRMRSAWQSAAAVRSLFASVPLGDEGAYEALLDLSVEELRTRLGVPRDGVTSVPRELHHYAPAAAPR